MMNSRKVIALATCSLAAAVLLQQAYAQQGSMDRGNMGKAAGGQPGMKAQQSGAMADGEIRKVDKDAGKLTIKHGPIPSMDMPMAMTMVYRVKDSAMLDQVKPGDKVKFDAEKVSGQFVVIRMQPVN